MMMSEFQCRKYGKVVSWDREHHFTEGERKYLSTSTKRGLR